MDPISATAIFSPSVARIAASTARDWSFVDSWLASKFSRWNPVPSFERNNKTLQALLALASASQAVDEDNALLARSNAVALDQLPDVDSASPRDAILKAIGSQLSHEGSVALDCLANLALQTATHLAKPETLGSTMLGLQGTVVEMQHMTSRVDLLLSHVQHKADEANELLDSLHRTGYRPPSDAAKNNIDMQRQTKAMSTKLAKHPANDSWHQRRHVTIEDLVRHERECTDFMARSKELGAQLAALERPLPSDVDAARKKLDALERQLHDNDTL